MKSPTWQIQICGVFPLSISYGEGRQHWIHIALDIDKTNIVAYEYKLQLDLRQVEDIPISRRYCSQHIVLYDSVLVCKVRGLNYHITYRQVSHLHTSALHLP